MYLREMFIVAGPPGGGKSTVFGLRAFADRIFNADDRAAELNGGSYRGIAMAIRAQVNREFERFVHESIAARQRFAIETTLRSTITFEQAKFARAAGFHVAMIYVALESFDLHLERVTQRALLGGHAASEPTLRRIYDASLKNLSLAVDPLRSGIDEVQMFDNSAPGEIPKLALEVRSGRITRIGDNMPLWVTNALKGTDVLGKLTGKG